MAKKYLTLEEAASKLSMSTEDLRKIREKGDIRGFADRASWKFRDEDVENYARAMNPTSAASIPAYDDDDDQLPITAEDEPLLDDSSSDVRLILDDDLLAPELSSTADTQKHAPPQDSTIDLGGDETKQPGSEIRPSSAIHLGDDDSETTESDDDTLKMSQEDSVEEQMGEGSSYRGEVALPDSGISLTDDDEGGEEITYEAAQSQIIKKTPASDKGSGSDVKLAASLEDDETLGLDDGEASSVRLDKMKEHPDEGISLSAGSDVMGMDEEITLESLGSDVSVTPEIGDSDVKLVDNDSNVLMEAHEDEDGVTLAAGSSIIGGEEDSGISLEAADSGISLEAADSGISLESLDSGINLTDETTEVDFGLEPDDSGITLQSDDDSQKTHMMESLGSVDDPEDFNDTAFEIDAQEESSEYEISGLNAVDEDEDDDTSVLLLDDEDESDAVSATMIGAGADDFDDEDAFDLGDDMIDEFGDSDMLVEETVVGDDDELDDLDVFDAVDEDFEDDFGEMGSAGEFAAPVGMRMAAPPEAEMGTGVFVGVLLSSVMMAACCLMMIDLARTMWSYEQPAPFTSPLLDMIKGMFA